MNTRVLIVDDHPVYRDGLAALIEATPGLAVLAAVGDGADAVEAAATLHPDVVLMDLNLPTVSGITATAQITAQPAPPAVLAVTMVDDDDTVLAALRAGARGYVLKGAPGDEIAAAIRTVAAGGAVFGSGIASRVLATGLTTPSNPPVPPPSELTEREREVLRQLAQGASNAQIARSLGLSIKTIQNYVSRILDKLQVADRTQAALSQHRCAER